METKTAEITSVQENQRSYDYQGTKYYVHAIRFKGSEHSWSYDSKTEKCEKFKVGESATFDCDVKVNGQYTNYKIKPKQEAGAGFAGKKAEPKDQGIITYLSCFSSACNFYSSKLQASDKDVFDMADQAFKKAFEKTTLNK